MRIGSSNTRGVIEEAARAERKTQPYEDIKMAVDHPKQATVSWGNVSSVIGPDDPIVYPIIAGQVSNSVELGLVFGRQAYRVSQAEAESCIPGTP